MAHAKEGYRKQTGDEGANEMSQLRDDDLQVYLTPDDAESAQVAGIQFARALAGAPAAAFMIALGEQEQIVRLVITDAGFSGDVARMAAGSFETGAKLEWQRLSSSIHVGAHGSA